MEASPETASWLLDTWTAKLADAVETMTGERPEVAWQAGRLSVAGETLWWCQPFEGIPQAEVWTGAPQPAWFELGTLTLRGAGIETSEPGDARNTYLEIVSQALSGLAQALGGRVGREVTCEGGREGEPPGDAAAFTFELKLGSYAATLGFCFSPGIARPLDGDAAGDRPAIAGAAPVPTAAPQVRSSQTIDLLMDIELPVSVSFGRAELALKDVLKLTTGSIVELNRAISEPVEVIVNNCVVARGEVVVVDGNYGVRVQEIISRENRLRTLR
jgi:flagellar motor switch protein FliN